jgi:hypothetical protein
LKKRSKKLLFGTIGRIRSNKKSNKKNKKFLFITNLYKKFIVFELNKSFLLLFFKKEGLASFLLERLTADRRRFPPSQRFSKRSQRPGGDFDPCRYAIPCISSIRSSARAAGPTSSTGVARS